MLTLRQFNVILMGIYGDIFNVDLYRLEWEYVRYNGTFGHRVRVRETSAADGGKDNILFSCVNYLVHASCLPSPVFNIGRSPLKMNMDLMELWTWILTAVHLHLVDVAVSPAHDPHLTAGGLHGHPQPLLRPGLQLGLGRGQLHLPAPRPQQLLVIALGETL